MCGESTETGKEPRVPFVLLEIFSPEGGREISLKEERDGRLLPSREITVDRLPPRFVPSTRGERDHNLRFGDFLPRLNACWWTESPFENPPGLSLPVATILQHDGAVRNFGALDVPDDRGVCPLCDAHLLHVSQEEQ